MKQRRPRESHGMNGTPMYYVWRAMISRCTLKSHPAYQRYGARGISVCDRWRDSFVAFYADMGDRPSSEHSIDRINNDGNYEPGNCRWATKVQQQRNMRSNRVTAATAPLIRADSRSRAEVAAEYGIAETYVSQIRSGKRWSS